MLRRKKRIGSPSSASSSEGQSEIEEGGSWDEAEPTGSVEWGSSLALG